VGPAQDLQRYWQAQEAARRRATPWLAEVVEDVAAKGAGLETQRLETT